jgi:hypothetical protein
MMRTGATPQPDELQVHTKLMPALTDTSEASGRLRTLSPDLGPERTTLRLHRVRVEKLLLNPPKTLGSTSDGWQTRAQ